MSGGGGSSTTVQKADPWVGVQPYLEQGYADAQSLYQSGGPQYYPGQTYVGMNPYERQAQNMALGSIDPMNQSIGAMNQGLQFSLNAPDVANNPYVSGMADVIQNRMSRQLSEDMMPAIQGGAIQAGQLGGSRQGVAEGLAARGVSEATGDALAQLYGSAYGTGLEAQNRALALAPQTLQASLMPSQVMGQVGDFYRGFDEMALGSNMDRWNYNQNLPYQNLSNYMNVLQGAPWGSSTTGQAPGTSPLIGALGGGLAGAAAAPMMGSMLGLANPVTWPFALGGAVLGGLFS